MDDVQTYIRDTMQFGPTVIQREADLKCASLLLVSACSGASFTPLCLADPMAPPILPPRARSAGRRSAGAGRDPAGQGYPPDPRGGWVRDGRSVRQPPPGDDLRQLPRGPHQHRATRQGGHDHARLENVSHDWGVGKEGIGTGLDWVGSRCRPSCKIFGAF